jgi:hypothetical protein
VYAFDIQTVGSFDEYVPYVTLISLISSITRSIPNLTFSKLVPSIPPLAKPYVARKS